jgi:hypothetical protein
VRARSDRCGAGRALLRDTLINNNASLATPIPDELVQMAQLMDVEACETDLRKLAQP